MLARLSPTIAVNTSKVKSVEVVRYGPGSVATDNVSGDHVVILFDRGPQMTLKKELDFDTVVHALEGGCHYHKVYLDEVGQIDVCVQHDEISDEPDTGNKKDRFRRCNAMSLRALLMPRKEKQ
jgi:hypothetical protein